jgi:hypothetical protein
VGHTDDDCTSTGDGDVRVATKTSRRSNHWAGPCIIIVILGSAGESSERDLRPVRLAYQLPANSTFLSEQISISHRPNEQTADPALVTVTHHAQQLSRFYVIPTKIEYGNLTTSLRCTPSNSECSSFQFS